MRCGAAGLGLGLAAGIAGLLSASIGAFIAGLAICRASMLKTAPSSLLRVTIVSISVIFLSATFNLRASMTGLPASSTMTSAAATP